ncbi:MAG: CHAD domain-containing protein [Verrucomicrobia bacterium]|nr:CHAD domain-containing protein [Verrucomicrobiota bacterium]
MEDLDVSLHANEPVRTGVLRVADILFQNAGNRIRHPTRDSAEDIHAIRVIIKRLRALLRLIRPVLNKTVFDRENSRLRTAAHRLAFERDADVARQTLAMLPRSQGHQAEAVKMLSSQKNGDSQPETIQARNYVEMDLERTRRSLHGMRISRAGWDAIEPGLTAVYRKCRKRMQRALRRGEDDAFHKWRITVKHLYYELQMLRPVWPKRLDKMIARLSQLQEKIGTDHDLVILKRSLASRPHPTGDAEGVDEVLQTVADEIAKLRKLAKPLGKTIFLQSPRRFVRKMKRHWVHWRMRARHRVAG